MFVIIIYLSILTVYKILFVCIYLHIDNIFLHIYQKLKEN